jgi:hypothetical protein
MSKMLVKTGWLLGWLSAFALLAWAAVGGSTVHAARPVPDGVQGELSIGEVGARLGPSLPWLLGMQGPRTYLVLVQNNHELRATGGFIAAVGRVSVDGGRLAGFDFDDSYALYSDRSTYPPAPLAMQEYMGIPLLVMRDANWSPDFPTTAQVARALYAQETGQQVDGVFTVDLSAVKQLVGAIGALDVPGADEPITGDNIEEQVIRFWETPVGAERTIAAGMNMEWFGQRKDFIPAIARAALDRVQGGDVNYGALLAAAQAAMDERSIQIWVNNPQVQSVMAEARWDGGLHPLPGADYLAVVDTNMGYNKVDAAIRRTLAYSVSWPEGPDQPALATVTITYAHPITVPDPGCDQSPRYGTAYADMIARCYFNYVRVFAPAGSELVEASGLEDESIISRRGERGTREFAGFFVLPTASEQQVSFTYRLPTGITPDAYRLLVQRQSGTQPLPIALDVDGVTQATTLAEGWLDWSAQ